jgi:hypothetical protein
MVMFKIFYINFVRRYDESNLIKIIFPKINFILGNNAVETKGVMSNFFRSDLAIFRKNYSQEQKIILGNKKWSKED